jgi:hypothetical protein
LSSAWTNSNLPSGVPDGTFYWLTNHGGDVTTTAPLSGTKSLDMVYPAVANDVDSGTEQRFILPQLCTGGFGMEWDQRISSNFFLRSQAGGTTSKWFQMWRSGYSTSFTIGASFRRAGGANVDKVEMMPIITNNNGAGIAGGPNDLEVYPSASSRILISPLSVTGSPVGILVPGQTQRIRFWVRYSSAFNVFDGRYEIWVDDTLFVYADCEIWPHVISEGGGATPGIQYGYVMGYTNAGYDAATTWTWDNLKFYSGATRWF